MGRNFQLIARAEVRPQWLSTFSLYLLPWKQVRLPSICEKSGALDPQLNTLASFFSQEGYVAPSTRTAPECPDQSWMGHLLNFSSGLSNQRAWSWNLFRSWAWKCQRMISITSQGHHYRVVQPAPDWKKSTFTLIARTNCCLLQKGRVLESRRF